MQTSTRQKNIALAEEIKALLILLLLKGGAHSEEIEMALRIASGQTIFNSNSKDTVCPLVPEKAERVTPKQIVRNEYLAPIQSYAA